MKRFLSLALAFSALCLSLFVASCASTKAREVAFVDISGDWILSSVIHDSLRHSGYPGAQQYIDNLATSGKGIRITFSAKKNMDDDFIVSGFSGVNSYGGILSFSGEKLIESPLAVTLAAGTENDQRFESFFLDALNGIDFARLSEDGDVLELSGNKFMYTLVFRRFSLEGTAWNLLAYNSGRALQSTKSLEIPGITFGEGKNFSGSTGVNRMLGFYSSDSSLRSLSFDSIATTRMGAPSDEMAALESLFVRCLEMTSAYRISASALTLISKDGVSLLVFSPAR